MQRRSRGLRELCRLLGYTPQAYYQYQKQLQERSLKEELVIQQVICHRRLQPRLGARKLLVVMQPFMAQCDIHIGRDVFFELLRVNGFLIRRRRRGSRTTFSAHRLKKYPDLVKGHTVSRADELWVSDITYIHLKRGFAYLSLITDAYSRRIMGFELSRDLSAAGCAMALQMALRNRSGQVPLIHHSDRGIQYCSAEYIKLLNENQVSISMTQSGDPRDNAIAERVNGIFKQELLNRVYPNFKQASEAISKAIDIYNHYRPHSSVDMLTPEKAHIQTGEIRRRWKSYYKTAAKEAVTDG
jgi:transposase InsO family protein